MQLQQSSKNIKTDLSKWCSFGLVQIIRCSKCNGSRVQNSSALALSLQYCGGNILDMLDNFFNAEGIQFNCPRCGQQEAAKSMHLSSLPQLLILQIMKLKFVDGVPQKIEAQVTFPEITSLEKYLIGELPQDIIADEPPVDVEALVQLISMGFPEDRSRKALSAASGNIDQAMTLILEGLEDKGTSVSEVDPQSKQLLMDAGFDEAQAERALRETVGV